MRGGAGRGPRRSGQPGRRPRSTDSGCWHAPLARRQWCSLPCCGVCARSSCCLAACLHTARWAGLVFWEAARAWRLACLLRAVWQGRKGGLKVEGRSTALLLTNDNHQTFGPSRLHHRQRAGAPMVQCGVVSPNRCWPPLCCCWGRGGGGHPRAIRPFCAPTPNQRSRRELLCTSIIRLFIQLLLLAQAAPSHAHSRSYTPSRCAALRSPITASIHPTKLLQQLAASRGLASRLAAPQLGAPPLLARRLPAAVCTAEQRAAATGPERVREKCRPRRRLPQQQGVQLAVGGAHRPAPACCWP